MIKEGVEYWKCKDEQQFKMEYIRRGGIHLCAEDHKIFCIETEETVKGFPDVMEVVKINHSLITSFYEFKFSDSKGRIKFQPTQPAFYKNNKFMDVQVIAFNQVTGNVHIFHANDIFDNYSPYKINLKAEINLTKVEEKKNG